jgi:arsenite-transporting ATPase
VSALDALLASLPRTTLVVGKGGVGKTTCAAGIAASFAGRGDRTLLLSTDPAAALADAIDAPVGADASPLPNQPNLSVRQPSARTLREDFLNRWRSVIADIVDRGTYLDRHDVDGLVDAALPGGDEIFALLALADLLREKDSLYDRIVVDTAPTGHTLRLLALPETFRALLAMLDAMQEKHRFMVRALTHRYRRDAADAFLDEMRARVDTLRSRLVDGASVAAVVVTRAEPMVVAESARYVERLRALGIRIAGVIVNAASDDLAVTLPTDAPVYRLPVVEPPPRGLDAIEGVMQALTRSSVDPPRVPPRRVVRSDGAAVDPRILVRALTIVGGKGGVGKTTVACALALSVSADERPALLVSTDPAPSLADAFGQAGAPWARADVEASIDGVPGLVVRQMDASAAFARARDAYQSRIDALFDALTGRGVDLAADRAILRDLLALAPPGVDELFALSTLGEALFEDRRFRHVIVDPAPTGHLLRLLEMPAIALDWSHRIMRLMLEYREIAGLGEAARDLLDFAKRTRALDALLRDASQSTIVLVSLDEPLVRAETARLASAIRERGIDVGGIVWNRAAASPQPLPATGAARQFVADETRPPPVGERALRDWSLHWRYALPKP